MSDDCSGAGQKRTELQTTDDRLTGGAKSFSRAGAGAAAAAAALGVRLLMLGLGWHMPGWYCRRRGREFAAKDYLYGMYACMPAVYNDRQTPRRRP